MTFTGMSAADQYPVSAELKSLGDEAGLYPATAHNPDNTQVGGIFLPGCASQVSASIGTPVAQEAYNLWFKAHTSTPSICAIICSVVKCLPVIAPLGQAATQTPQPLHTASLITDTSFSSSKEIAL